MLDLNRRRAGILLHPSSLPGPHGLGDFGPAAMAFVDWLHEARCGLWQWLPTTPIGPGDSPYQSVSAFAGNPLFVALEPLVERGWLAATDAPAFDDDAVDFAAVVPWRMAQLERAAQGFAERAAAADRQAFAAWCDSQAPWLDDYALFMALHNDMQHQHGQFVPWWQWPAALARRDRTALADARHTHGAAVRQWCFIQWCFDSQLQALREHAGRRGVALVGDLPLYVAHHSADCWARPDLFELDDHFLPTAVAGVPPDALAPEGQRWGNPLYRWPRMQAEGFAWWKARLARAFAQAEAVRIDHFRGLAAYWEVPTNTTTAAVGRWMPAPGPALFEALREAFGALPILAEDLGYITDDVHALREQAGLPGMKILQFAFGGTADGEVAAGTHEFLPHHYPRRCVVYTGTHDNDTARGWWNHAPEHERAAAAQYLACGADDVHEAMLRVACQSVANLAIFPLQDFLGLDSRARMNTPGTVGGSNWRWRVRQQDLSAALAQRINALVLSSGRASTLP
jgi:4-alpha-glucanotransferase